MGKKLTTEEFIKRAKEVHGDKYDYSKVEYKNNHTKVKIICLIHGVFKQEPRMHLSGEGCVDCSGSRKKTTEEFIEQAIVQHGNKYDYSKVEYKNTNTKVKIICPIHGEFEQTPECHLMGQGCSACSDVRRANILRKTTEQFIEDARAVHGNKYDYSQVKYVNNRTKVKIICPEHGIFKQEPRLHLSGKGCQECGKAVIQLKYDLGITQSKIFEARKKNGTLNTSQPEEDLYELLCNKFGVDDVFRQYKDKIRYPFNCDFYIKSLDLFIELNANWTHGRGLGFYDENNHEHQRLLQKWKDGNTLYYNKAIYVWTELDIKKRDTAIKNNLNYLVFWNNDLSDAKAWLNSI